MKNFAEDLTGETRIAAVRRLVPGVAHRGVRSVAVRVRIGLLRQVVGVGPRLVGEVRRRGVGRVERIRNRTGRKVTGERVLIEGGEERIVSVGVARRSGRIEIGCGRGIGGGGRG